MHSFSKFNIGLIALLMLMTPFAGLIGADDGEPSRFLATSYHDGTINVNLTHLNGTQADNYYVVFDSNSHYYDLSEVTDSAGKAELTIYWDYLGRGVFFVQDPLGRNVHMEYLTVFPDQVIYKDISIGEVLPADRTLTGRVFNESSGTSLSGATVEITGHDSNGNYFMATNVTDSAGSYSISFPLSNSEPFSIHTSVYGYISHRHYFHTNSDKLSYREDIPLLPVYSSDGLTRIRYLNSSTGEPFTNGWTYITEFPESEDHRMNYQSTQMLGPEGWFKVNSGKGELAADVSLTVPEYQGSSLYLSNLHLINGTPEDIEYEVMVPDNITLKITVKNSSGNMNTGNIYSYETIYSPGATIHFSHSSSIQPDGTYEISVPANRTLDFSFNAISHMPKDVQISTYPEDPTSVTIMLEEVTSLSIGELPQGEVEIHVIDDEGGFPVRDADLYGYLMHGGTTYYISQVANETGVFKGMIPTGTYQLFEAYTPYGRGYTGKVIVGASNNGIIEIRIVRDEVDEILEPKSYHATFLSPAGLAVPGVPIRIFTMAGQYYYSNTYFTDSDGRVGFNANPGSTVTISTDYDNGFGYNPWAFATINFYDISPAGGEVGVITMMNRGVPGEILGFIRDSVTGETLQSANLNAYSYHPSEGRSRPPMYLPPTIDGVELFTYSTYSTLSGLYRIWCMDHVKLEVRREGYFPKSMEIDLTTRSESLFDILLDPLPDHKFWVNGTVVDDYGTGTMATITVYDTDNPLITPEFYQTDENGAFSIQLYGGNYSFNLENYTLIVEHDVAVTMNISDLELVLYASSVIFGIVNSPEGEPSDGVELILESLDNGTYVRIMNATANETGYYLFDFVRIGIYRIRINESDIHEEFISYNITTDGWADVELNIDLSARTEADIIGIVTGEEGPLHEGIPDTEVTLVQAGSNISVTMTGPDGSFEFLEVPHGVYEILAVPPEPVRPVVDIRSGYGEERLVNLTITGMIVDVEMVLPFVEYEPPVYANVTYFAPNGSGIYLDEPLMIEFSLSMNVTSVENGIIISPELGNLSFMWDEAQAFVFIEHDDFMPETTYTVSLDAMVFSYEGYPMWDTFEWEFVTGTTTDPWDIYDVNITMDDYKNVTVIVEGPVNLTILFVLENVGFLEMVEGPNGTYTVDVDGSMLLWDFEHHYYFTKVFNGYDMATEFAGSLITPEEPEVQVPWEITSVDIDIRESGTWDVKVEAPEGLTIYIVIDGVGSFEVREDAPGFYRVLIPYENFDWDEEYDYHFSDTEDGSDLSPSNSGSERTPLEPEAPPGDDDPPFFLCCLGILVVLVIIIVVIIVIMRKKDEGFDEE